MEPDSKYLVIKKSDIEEWAKKYELNAPFIDALAELEKLEVPDACVLRCQDIFVPPALDAYVSGIRIALSLSETQRGPVKERLEDIADYFHQRAMAAWHLRRRLPT